MRPKLTYANVAATLALFIAIGGASAFAASQLGKNTVGPRQLKKNAVTTTKLNKEAVTAAKVKKGSLTGTQINASTLGTVPNAQDAQTAQMAQMAQTANTIAAPEPWHEVGAPGGPPFSAEWENFTAEHSESAGFFKDHEGVVHLKGVVKRNKGEETKTVIFQLPPGYRPGAGKVIVFPVACEGSCSGTVTIVGPGVSAGMDGGVTVNGYFVHLNGITFRAES